MEISAKRAALVAVDLGAQSCRVSLLRLKQGQPQIHVVHRFPNAPTATQEGLRWDISRIFDGVKDGLRLCARAAHMWGLPALKSCMMIVTTTRVPCEWATVMRPLSWLEFQTDIPESPAKVPSSWTCRPKKATVLSSEKFQLG